MSFYKRENSYQRSRGAGGAQGGLVGVTPDIGGFKSQPKRASKLSNEWVASIKRNPDKAFHFYMLRWPHTRKIGVHLQDWLTLAREHPETLSLEKARQQVNEWIERNRAALK